MLAFSLLVSLFAGQAALGADYHHGATCVTCHQLRGSTSNLAAIRGTVVTPSSGSRTAVFTALEGTNSFADGDGTYNGICEVCHTTTDYHRNDGSGDPDHNAGTDCTACHPHTSAFAPTVIDHAAAGVVVALAECTTCHEGDDPVADVHDNDCGLCHLNTGGGGPMVEPHETLSPDGGDCSDCHGALEDAHAGVDHTATPETGAVVIFPDNAHDSAGWIGPKPYFDVAVDCDLCHATDLPLVHAQQCSTCHPTPYDTLGTWGGTCAEGGCHTEYHADSAYSHWDAEEGDCSVCHDWGSWQVLQENCLNCHAGTSA